MEIFYLTVTVLIFIVVFWLGLYFMLNYGSQKPYAKKILRPLMSQRDLDTSLVELCQRFDEDNREVDINKLIDLLDQGANPNQWISIRVDDGMDDDWIPIWHTKNYSLLDRCKDQAVREVLRAYGAKTTDELIIEENTRRKEKEAEERRMRPIIAAEKKAKTEDDLKKVKIFLSSKHKV